MKQSRYISVNLPASVYDLEKIKLMMSYVPFLVYRVRHSIFNSVESIVIDAKLSKPKTSYRVSKLLERGPFPNIQPLLYIIPSVLTVLLTLAEYNELLSVSTYIYVEDIELEKLTEKRKRETDDFFEKYGVESVASDVTDYFQVNPIIKKSKTYLPRVNKNLSAESELASILKRCEEMTK